MSVRLMLVRHGRVDFEDKGFRDARRGPQWDPPLDATGREQAAKLAARLASVDPPAAVYVSPFRRCLETVRPYTDATGIQAEVVEDLREVFVGAWEGVRFEDLISDHEELIRRRVDDHEPLYNLAPGAETCAELRRRVVPVVERLISSVAVSAGGTDASLLLVTHGGVINAYLGHVLGLSQDMFFFPENCSISVVDVEGDARRIRFLNDVAHLWYPVLWHRERVEGRDRPEA